MSTSRMTLRSAVAEDADGLAAIFSLSRRLLTFLPELHSIAEDHWFITNVILNECDVTLVEWVSDENNRPQIISFLARQDSEIRLLHTHPDHIGSGAGGLLLSAVKDAGPARLELWCFQDNVRARTFYEAHGFQPIQFTDGSGNEEKTPDVQYRWQKLTRDDLQNLTIRRLQDSDINPTRRLFHQAVNHGARTRYDAAQRSAWSPKPPDLDVWTDRLASQTTFVATLNDRVIGFMTLAGNGLIDLAFVAPDVMGLGIAARLYEAIEAEARDRTIARLHTEASHLARPFFERQRWTLVREQAVSIRGQSLTNFVMEKYLPVVRS